MLSTAYRLRLDKVCKLIVEGKDVELTEMIWAQKLAKSNTTAATWLRQARQRAANPDMKKGGTVSYTHLTLPTNREV